MVSTRSVRYKFSEGERVLCYEPDPTKAKVLYDSKVLEVIESKDKRGRRTVEYLIHFQGWNSSWDRCVSEDFVLKDTEENRQLQRDLAEKSQLQLGAYLYRRERKKGNSTSSAGPAKRPRHGFSDDGSSSSTQPDGNGYSEGDTGDTDSSSGSASSNHPNSPPNSQTGRANIALPSALRDRLTFDYHLVVKRGRVSRLPASPCAAQILESFVQWFARAGAWNPPRARHDPPHKPDMLDVSCRLNLLREVADGLRVYFDFILRGHLLYKQEMDQYYEICGQYIDDPDIKSEPSDDDSHSQDDDLTLKDYAHLPPDPRGENGDANTSHENNDDEDEDVDVDDEKDEFENKRAKSEPRTDDGSIEPEPDQHDHESDQHGQHENDQHSQHNQHERDQHDQRDQLGQYAAPRGGNVARRLRSHKSVVSQSENEEPAPSTSTGEQRTFETMSSSVGSSGSSLCDGWRARPAPPPAPHTRTPLSLLLDKVAKWQVIPREDTEHLPCRVYGAIHLARLFVKLPDFLNATQMPDLKLKLILKHIDMFIQYLDEHSEWFGEMFYIGDGVSRSH